MTSLPDAHRKALDATGRIVRGIDARQLSDPSPCESFDVRGLLNHVVSGNLWVEPLVSGKTIGEVGDQYDGDVLGDDPSAAYDASARLAGDAFARPGALEAPVAVSYGPVPGEIYAGHRFVDVLIHGWDLAVATGQDSTLDPELVETCWEIVRPQLDLLRGSGAFGTEVEVPGDADSQTRLLAALGRRAGVMVASTVETPVASQPQRRQYPKRLIVDAGVAIGLFSVALILRWHFPADGLFYDDAWQALGAVEGGFRQFMTVGQTQPGFGLELMVWNRIFGASAATMVTPALIAGALGPPALYLVLRKFGYAVSISLLLGAALTVCETAITYSGTVKSYTSDVLIILLLCVLLPWLSRKRWSVGIAVAWFVGSIAIASFSSFTLLASIAAGAVLVFDGRDDRKVRVISVGAQAVALVGLYAVEDRTHNARQLNAFFTTSESYIQLHLNPVTFGSELVKHLVRVTEIFPGGPGWLTVLCMVAATVGLVVLAWRGSKALVGRFLVLMVLLAVAGALAHRVPFGPLASTARVTLWLAPVVAFGLAVVLQRVYRAAVSRGTATRLAFDVVAFGLSALLLASAFGVPRKYHSSAALATQQVMAEAGPQDVIIIARSAMYTFALEAHTPVDLRATPDLLVGFKPRFKDTRLHPVDLLTPEAKQDITSALKKTNRAFVVDSNADPVGYKRYRSDLAALIAAQGFKPQKGQTAVGTGRVTEWLRPGTPPSAG